jgi:hypothetical protein
MGPTPSDLLGAIICLIAIFLPGFLLLLGALPFWDSFRKRPTAQAAAGPPFLSGNKVSPSISFRPLGVRPETAKGTWTMAAIGTFTSPENGFSGSIRTLALNIKARIARVETPPTRPALPHLRQRRARRRLTENLRTGPRPPLGQAGRPELPRSDLRHAGRSRWRRRRAADLVALERWQLRSRSTHWSCPGESFGPRDVGPLIERRAESVAKNIRFIRIAVWLFAVFCPAGCERWKARVRRG